MYPPFYASRDQLSVFVLRYHTLAYRLSIPTKCFLIYL